MCVYIYIYIYIYIYRERERERGDHRPIQAPQGRLGAHAGAHADKKTSFTWELSQAHAIGGSREHEYCNETR